ncbi:SDR family NAD(P)-dependent oxidoreductase, partial [Janthinobacterium sp.]|uniref:SDR family NAD(P)-dependent oxidoreductase n=1 Tax=Janthinobacterium sp. TaxID=1871054 RepID=UPI0025843057
MTKEKMNFLHYVLQEVKQRRLAHPNALEIMRQYHEGAGGAAPALRQPLHPLLHRNTSTLAGQRFSSTFSGQEFFLSDHAVRGARVLPGVAYLEMVRASLAQADAFDAAGAERQLCLHHVVWAQPLIVADEPVEVHVDLYTEADGRVAFDVRSADALHCQGWAVAVTPAPERVDLAGSRARCQWALPAGAVYYAGFAQLGLDYGPAFRALEQMHGSADEVVARLRLPSGAAAQAQGFVLHPSLLDAALQAVAGLGDPDERGGLMLPFGIDSVEIHGPCNEHMWALVRRVAHNASDQRSRTFDIVLCNDDGLVAARLRGYTSRLADNDAENAADAVADSASLLLQPQWREQAVAADAAQRHGRRHILLAGIDVTPGQLQAGVADTRCHLLPADFDGAVRALCAVVRDLLSGGLETPVLLQVVVPVDGPGHMLAGLAGVLRTARLEQPKLLGQLIAVSTAERLEHLISKLDDNSRCPDEVAIRYPHVDHAARQVLRWLEVTADPAPLQPWRAGGVYLLTGGLGGLGRLFAREIAQQAAGATLVLTGRRALDDGARAFLAELAMLGAQAEYRMTDLADRDAVQQLIAQVQQAHGALHGILHAAGVLRDGLLWKKTDADIDAVLAPKVAGVLHLDEASCEIELDWFICFSSISAAFGNMGQADYAAANGFLDAFAYHRDALVAQGIRHGRTLSINWPLWQDGGMGVEADALQELSIAGLLPLPSEEGLRAFYRALATAGPQALVVHGIPARIRQRLLAAAHPAPAAAVCAPPQGVPADAATDADADTLLHARLARMLAGAVCAQLKIRPEDIDSDLSLNDLGFDSISLTAFANTLNRSYGLDLTPTVLFEHSTLGGLASYLVREHRSVLMSTVDTPAQASSAAYPAGAPVAAPLPAAPAGRSRSRARPPATSLDADTAPPVAIIGVSGRFPQASDVDALWTNLAAGRDCIGEIADSRWDWSKLFGDPTAGGTQSNVKHAGVIDGIDEFDPLFFGISPKEAEVMDPQQRFLMMYVWKAFEDAGYAPQSISGSKTALLIGTSSSGYGSLLERAGQVVEAYSSTGAVASIGPNRMSFLLNLHGPSEPVETACSSALVAIHRAVELLQSGRCEMAVAGGVSLLISQDAHVSFNKAGMLSPDGRCQTFSAQANGYVRGEGVGMLVLKPLAAAERDGDQIYGVIRGTAENHGGKANSLTAPNPRAQADVIKAAMARAGVEPATIGYIEAHGTGTALGDPVEVQGLKTAFQELAAGHGGDLPAAYCGLGSIKTNIGHLELAAGVAGVIKVLLQMRHRTLVASLHCARLNPYIDLRESPFYVVTESRPWVAPLDRHGRPLPRRAGVSSFGFGGVNAHVVLEEYLAPPAQLPPGGPCLVVLSAKNAERLQVQARQLLQQIETGGLKQDDLANVAYTLQVGREPMEARLACVVATLDELRDKLERYLADQPVVDNVYRGEVKRHKEALAVFAADAELQEAISKWIARGKLDKLAELWVKGLSVDWSTLHGASKRQRLGLPTYPFARERYWAPAAGTVTAAAAAVLHPLLHRNTSTLAEQRFSTTFSGREFFLAEHIVRGKKVLPGVAHLEMARAAACEALDLGHAAAAPMIINDVRFLRPIWIDQAAAEFHLGLAPQADGHLQYRIYRRLDNGVEAVHSTGVIAQAAADAAEPLGRDLPALQAACSLRYVSRAQCYAAFAGKGLALGGAFQVVQEIHVGDRQVLARLQLPESVTGEAGRYVIHPSMMDAAMQASIGLLVAAGEVDTRLSLPYGLERMEIHGRTTATMWSYLRVSPETRADDLEQRMDLDLCHEDGRVCVRFVGLVVRMMNEPAAPGAAEASAPETILLQPQWRDVPACADAASEAAPWALPGRRLVLLAHPAGAAANAALQAALPSARCETLPEDYAQQAETVLMRLQQLLASEDSLDAAAAVQVVVPIAGAGRLAVGLAGLLKSAQLEHPRLTAQLIAVGNDIDPPQLAAMLTQDLGRPQERDIRYLDGTRKVLDWAELPPGEACIPWKDGGVYLITGGLGGLGRLFAHEIAARAKAVVLVLTGRRTLDELATQGGQQAIRELEALGAAVEYRVLDVADADGVRQLVLEVQETYSALDGIIHSAGILDDSLLRNKPVPALRQVLAPKVAGLINLDQASRDIELDCFICFSSLSAMHGNVGQADYAAANAFMDAYASQRNTQVAAGQRSGHTLSVNWPLWKDGAMRVSPATELAMAQRSGMLPLSTASGIAALYQALGAQLDQVAVLEGNGAQLRQFVHGAGQQGTAPAPAVRAALPVAVAPASAAPASAAPAAPIPAAGTDGLLEKVRRMLMQTASRQLKLKLNQINIDAEMSSYGFDSLMLSEFVNALNQEFALGLAPTIFYEYPTLASFAHHLSEQHRDVL